MSRETYNGWSNRETWNANLWLSNEEGLYREVNRMASNVDKSDDWDVERFAKRLEDFCKELWPNGKTPDDDELSGVDWEEVAKSWLED